MLDISRIEAGQIALSLEPVQLSGLLDETLQLVAGLAAQSNVDIQRNVPVTHWARVDRQRCKQILLNLLSNAVKYNRPGGSVSVTATVDNGHLQTRVRDTGQGIRGDLIADLFVPFNRLGADSSKIEGSGLGLSLSRALAEAMGGSVTLEATSPAGSTFLLQLSAAQQRTDVVPLESNGSAPAGQPAGDPPRPVGDHAILYIEDNLANVELLEEILGKRPNITLIPAIQASIGLDLARTKKPSMILLDLHLPDMPGEQALRQLKRDPLTAAIPIVILTADAINAKPDQLLAQGARAFLSKPIDVQRLIDVVDAVLLEVESP